MLLILEYGIVLHTIYLLKAFQFRCFVYSYLSFMNGQQVYLVYVKLNARICERSNCSIAWDL